MTPTVLRDIKVRLCDYLCFQLSWLTDIIQSLLDILEKNLIRANRDNDLIYHKDVPAGPALSAILRTSVVQSNVPTQLQDPKSAIGSAPMIFGELLGWGAETAIGQNTVRPWSPWLTLVE